MVKHLHHTAKLFKLLLLALLLFIIWGGIWLQSSEHSLNRAKPWILSSINQPDAPYTIDFDTISIDWQRMTELGKLHISHITFKDREGATFAEFPEISASVDFLNLFTGRTLLNTVFLNDAKLSLTRSKDDVLYIGIAGAESQIALSDLAGTYAASKKEEAKEPEKIRLPFKRLRLDGAQLAFRDEILGQELIGDPAQLHIDRKRGNYTATLQMPFEYKDGNGSLSVELKPANTPDNYTMNVLLARFPGEFICSIAPCPEKTAFEGKLSGAMRLGLTADGTFTQSVAKIGTNKALLTAPDWFAKPVALTNSEITITHDKATQTVEIEQARFGLEDTTISGTVKAMQKEDGWYVDARGQINAPLDVTKLYKYWPISMAPGTRDWVTSKLKSGRADTGSAHLMLTPEDIAGDVIFDKALSADVAARDITLEYLPGFPLMHHLDGDIHFTGTTVKIEGKNGTLLSGTAASKATLWCPDLNNPKIPMEATIYANVPIADAAEFLTLKHFTFDDKLTLSKSATGSGTLAMTLKFNSFSENSKKSDELNFDDVFYDITANITGFGQEKVAGGYKVSNLSGELKASNQGVKFNGALALGNSGASDVTLDQPDGKPLQLTVKSKTPQPGKPGNDFSLTYKGGAVPDITLKGKRLDATADYESGKKDSGILADFPKMRLNLDLAELYMTPELAFNDISAVMACGERCETLRLRARTGKGSVAGDIVNEDGKRQLIVTASDAGAFITALGITDRVMRGKLELRGKYNDSQSPAPFDGRLIITDYTLKNSQILGRILSVGSLTGLANLLTGSGIAFDKLSANIDAKRGVITIVEGRTSGNAMGMTVGGTVDTNSTQLALKGVVVPAYALNSMVEKIPVIGNLLVGGKGEGLIAFNYSVRGTYDKPDVMVNPLSGLTPGFLRGIFGIFDGPPPKEGEKATETQKDN